MKIAIVSDSHGRTENVQKALASIEPYDVSHIIHCGDIDNADIVNYFPAHTHFVYGNCDHDRNGIRRAVDAIGAKLYEPFGELKLGAMGIAFVHSDNGRLFRSLQTSEQYDFVFYGHTHEAKEHIVGKTRVVNPGALHRANPKSFVILDLETKEYEYVEVN